MEDVRVRDASVRASTCTDAHLEHLQRRYDGILQPEVCIRS